LKEKEGYVLFSPAYTNPISSNFVHLIWLKFYLTNNNAFIDVQKEYKNYLKLGCEIWLTKLYNDIKALYACKYCDRSRRGTTSCD
jgi:hypothetical protein